MAEVEGDLVDFEEIGNPPNGIMMVAEVPENQHEFYVKDGRLYMQNCVGIWYEIVGDWKHLSYEDISYDYEAAGARQAGVWSCDLPERRPRDVRVRNHRRRSPR